MKAQDTKRVFKPGLPKLPYHKAESKIFALGLVAGNEVWKVRFNSSLSLSVSCAFIIRVAEAPADYESTNEEVSLDVAVAIN